MIDRWKVQLLFVLVVDKPCLLVGDYAIAEFFGLQGKPVSNRETKPRHKFSSGTFLVSGQIKICSIQNIFFQYHWQTTYCGRPQIRHYGNMGAFTRLWISWHNSTWAQMSLTGRCWPISGSYAWFGFSCFVRTPATSFWYWYQRLVPWPPANWWVHRSISLTCRCALRFSGEDNGIVGRQIRFQPHRAIDNFRIQISTVWRVTLPMLGDHLRYRGKKEDPQALPVGFPWSPSIPVSKHLLLSLFFSHVVSFALFQPAAANTDSSLVLVNASSSLS
jgi:hypothetical protein